ncbi:hypothetical protein WJX72_010019 [[Myrmecia] bisecta]|uniref:DNA-directed RNA polymerase subunit n=1 Tax=[Myrmecia] bisecta TaxID=41462 RepID=A0AAW1QSE1_9CHLO
MAQQKAWMFCPISGALLEYDIRNAVAVCPLSTFRKDLADIQDIKTEHKCNMDDYRKRFNLEPLVKAKEDEEMEELMQGRSRATVDEDCPECGHHGLEFYTMQLRSADEGQTVFYECPDCGHKWSQNT